MMDVQAIRREFPIFGQTLPKGLPVTFLDSAASAQKPSCVIESERQVMESHYANAYRGVHRFGAQIDDELEATREAVRKLINAESVEEIAFTSGATASLNMVAFGWGRRHLQHGDEILLNLLEHHANFVPWQQVAQETGARIKLIPLTEDCRLDLSQLEDVLTERTKIVSVTGMSNVTGTITPLEELAHRARDVGALFVVDGAQCLPHGSLDVRSLEIDFLAFSGHKLYGPTGIGVLYGRRDRLEETAPLLFGGHMIDRVEVEHSTWAALPARFEAGTLPIVQAIALRTAIEFITEIGFDEIHQHERALTEYAHQQLGTVPGIRIMGPAPAHKGAIISFTMQDAHPEDLAQLLDRRGVFVRHGHHCTMPLHVWLGIPASVRASFGVYSTHADVENLIAALHFARQKLRLE